MLQDNTKSNYAFKTLLNKAHTSNSKDLSNEKIVSGIILSSDKIFSDKIYSTPNYPGNVNVVSEQLSLILINVKGTKSYTCHLGEVPISLFDKINPVTGSFYNIGDRINYIIPESYGSAFRPILYRDEEMTNEVQPTHECDWFLDPFSGLIFQSNDAEAINLSNGRLKCYLYIGNFINDKLPMYLTSYDMGIVVSLNNSEPNDPVLGARYIITENNVSVAMFNPLTGITTPNTIVPTNSIIEYNASGWIITPPLDGMVVYIQNDNLTPYRYYNGIFNKQIFTRSYPINLNKDMKCKLTAHDGDLACLTPIAGKPSEGSYVQVCIDGLTIPIEDNATVGADVTKWGYFSGDFNTPHATRQVRKMSEIQPGDKFYWMPSNVNDGGVQLDSTIRISFLYSVNNL